MDFASWFSVHPGDFDSRLSLFSSSSPPSSFHSSCFLPHQPSRLEWGGANKKGLARQSGFAKKRAVGWICLF